MEKTTYLFTAVFYFLSSSLSCEETLLIDFQKAVYTGLKNNREMVYRKKKNIIAEKNLKLKFRDYFPEMKISYSDSANVVYYQPDSHIKKLGLTFSQNIYNKGRKVSEIRLGEKQIMLEKLRIKDAEEEYAFKIISAFKEILKLEMEISILKNTYIITSRQLEIGKREKELGEITELIFLKMAIAHKNIELLLEKKRNEKGNFIFTFSRLLTLNPEIKLKMEGEINIQYKGFTEDNAGLYLKSAKERNTLYKEKLLAREAAYHNYKISLKQNIPDIKADCGLSMSGRQFPLNEPGFNMTLAFSLDKPGAPSLLSTGISKEDRERTRTITAETRLFSDLQNIHSTELSRVDLDKAVWEIEDFISNNEFNIRKALLDIKSLKKELSLIRTKLEITEKKKEIEKLQMSLGEIKRIDYMESCIELSREKINLVNSISSLYQKEISLLRMCGINSITETGSRVIINNKGGLNG